MMRAARLTARAEVVVVAALDRRRRAARSARAARRRRSRPDRRAPAAAAARRATASSGVVERRVHAVAGHLDDGAAVVARPPRGRARRGARAPAASAPGSLLPQPGAALDVGEEKGDVRGLAGPVFTTDPDDGWRARRTSPVAHPTVDQTDPLELRHGHSRLRDARSLAPVDADRWIDATYRVRSAAGDIDARAQAHRARAERRGAARGRRRPARARRGRRRVDDIVPVAPDEFEVGSASPWRRPASKRGSSSTCCSATHRCTTTSPSSMRNFRTPSRPASAVRASALPASAR